MDNEHKLYKSIQLAEEAIDNVAKFASVPIPDRDLIKVQYWVDETRVNLSRIEEAIEEILS